MSHHPLFANLKPEYSQLLSQMVVRDECRHLVDEVAVKLVGFKSRYQQVTDQNGVPVIFIGPSFEREASSDFNLSPAQGDPWRRISHHVPARRGPFPSWVAAALDAYHINGLDKVGAQNWTWELMCFYGEMFNGFGYRDVYHMHSPYLWGGTNLQTRGKYTTDHGFDPNEMDGQLGIIPVAKRMVDIDPSLALPFTLSPPITSGASNDAAANVSWIQELINALGRIPKIDVDGSFGRETREAVMDFQTGYGLDITGIADEITIKALRAAQQEAGIEL